MEQTPSLSGNLHRERTLNSMILNDSTADMKFKLKRFFDIMNIENFRLFASKTLSTLFYLFALTSVRQNYKNSKILQLNHV